MKSLIVTAIFVICLSACATSPKVQLTPMEIQALQTREFETSKDIAFSAVLSVFQDLGYTINSADKETGFITAISASKSSNDWLFTGAQFNTQTRATATVEPIVGALTETSRVRLNFVTGTQTSTVYGQSRQKDLPILDSAVYQNAFEKIDTAIFVRSAE